MLGGQATSPCWECCQEQPHNHNLVLPSPVVQSLLEGIQIAAACRHDKGHKPHQSAHDDLPRLLRVHDKQLHAVCSRLQMLQHPAHITCCIVLACCCVQALTQTKTQFLIQSFDEGSAPLWDKIQTLRGDPVRTGPCCLWPPGCYSATHAVSVSASVSVSAACLPSLGAAPGRIQPSSVRCRGACIIVLCVCTANTSLC